MSRTLLYTVQRVLEKLDLDDVNSINDSPDAVLVAREAENTFYDLLNRNEWPEQYDSISVASVGDVNNPTALQIPADVLKIKSLRYDVAEAGASDKSYKEMKKISNEDFLDLCYNRKSSDSNVTVADNNGVELFVYNDKAPEYFTTFDNETLIFDSYDSDVESTLQGSKTACIGYEIPAFVMDDAYVIPLDAKTYPLYLAEIAAACSISFNGEIHPEEERRRARGISRLRRDSYRTEKLSTHNDFGRRGTGRS